MGGLPHHLDAAPQDTAAGEVASCTGWDSPVLEEKDFPRSSQDWLPLPDLIASHTQQVAWQRDVFTRFFCLLTDIGYVFHTSIFLFLQFCTGAMAMFNHHTDMNALQFFVRKNIGPIDLKQIRSQGYSATPGR